VHLDIPTLIVVIVFINAIGGVLMIFSWLHSRGVTALLYWGAAYLIGAVGACLLGARDVFPQIWSMAGANALLLLASSLTWCGVRNFDNRPVCVWQMVGGSVVWLAACCIPVVHTSMLARIVVGSAIAATFAGLVVIDLWRGRHDGLMSRWLAMAVMSFHGVVFLARIVATWIMLPPGSTNLLEVEWLPIGMFEALFFSFCSAFVLLTMAKERAELRHKRAAFIDPLTSVPNRRGFFERADLLLARCRDEQSPVALLLFDLDHFKRINDTFGHQTGDDVLVAFCRAAQARLGPDDVFGRLGGEEFVCLMPDVSQASAYAIAERIRGDFEIPHRAFRGAEVHATVSVGLAGSTDAGRELTSLLGAADKALYQAKARGRNRVEGRRPALAVVAGGAIAPVPRGAA
jgi:diguanylate cyclase (GGDEF)-like protein